MGRYTYFENGKWRIKVGDTEFAGPWVDKLSYYEELAPNLENTKDEAYNLGYQTCLHSRGLTWSEARELRAYRATGLTVERAAELGKADREGRGLAMPCNVGDTVYVADPDECSWVMCPTVNNVIKHNHIWCVELDFGSTDRFPDMDIRPYPIDGFGKIVFLTREEAEKALEAENHERPDDQ